MLSTVAVATLFNVFFEYSMRGMNHLIAQPLLLPLLIYTYFTYYTLLEDLILRYRLKDYQAMVISFFLGTIYQCYVSGDAFIKPNFFGINLGRLLFVTLVWWGAIQTVMTMYLANRLAPRRWDRKPLSQQAWITVLLLNAFAVIVFQNSGIPKGTLLGKLTMIVILILTTRVFFSLLPPAEQRNRPPEFRPDVFIDVLSAFTVAVFILSSVALARDPVVLGSSRVNAPAVKAILLWTSIVAISMLVYRLVTRRPISV